MDHEGRLELFHALRAVSVELERGRVSFAKQLGIHPTDLHGVIALLDAARADVPATPTWLRERLELNSAGATKLIDRLETHGLVVRAPDPGDRRRTLLLVTESAVAAGQAFFDQTIQNATAAMDGFDDRKLLELRELLDTVLRAIKI